MIISIAVNNPNSVVASPTFIPVCRAPNPDKVKGLWAGGSGSGTELYLGLQRSEQWLKQRPCAVWMRECGLGSRHSGRMSPLTLYGNGAAGWSHGVIGRGAKTALQGVARPRQCLQCAQEGRRSREKREKLGPETASRRPRSSHPKCFLVLNLAFASM